MVYYISCNLTDEFMFQMCCLGTNKHEGTRQVSQTIRFEELVHFSGRIIGNWWMELKRIKMGHGSLT